MRVSIPGSREAMLDGRGNVNPRWRRFFEEISGQNATEGDVLTVGTNGTAFSPAASLEVSPPENLSFSYNPDGTISNVLGATTDIDLTYSNGLVDTVDDQTYLKTFNYNASDQLTSIIIT